MNFVKLKCLFNWFLLIAVSLCFVSTVYAQNAISDKTKLITADNPFNGDLKLLQVPNKEAASKPVIKNITQHQGIMGKPVIKSDTKQENSEQLVEVKTIDGLEDDSMFLPHHEPMWGKSEELNDQKIKPELTSNMASVNQLDASVNIDVLDLKNTDVMDVFKLISQKSKLNIVAGREVKGKVTIYLRDVEVKEVLRIIVEAYGWAYEQDEKIIRIMTDREYVDKHGHSFDQESETRIIQLAHIEADNVATILSQIKGKDGIVIAESNSGILILTDEPQKLDAMASIIKQMDKKVETVVFTVSYLDVDNVVEKLKELATPSIGKVNSDSRTNRIIVSDTNKKIDKMRKVIEAFDRKDKEVLIESKIVQITLSDEHKLGVDWEAVVDKFHNANIASDFDLLSASEKRGQISVGALASDKYTALIQALNTVGETNILSSPRIAAVNKKEAKILVGSTEPYVTTTTTTPASGPTTISEAVSFIEVGVKLYVTPIIHEDDFITMKIRPEVSSVTSNLTTSNNNTIPVVETSEAETTVTVKDQVTVVIGGLIKDETVNLTKQIPLLGKIPVLGSVFRSKSDSTTKTEIVILLTPKIISGDADHSDHWAAF